MSMVQPCNPAEPARDGVHDATQMVEQVVAAAVQPLRQNAGAVRTVTATSVSLPQGELREHEAFETWINAHGACPSCDRGKRPSRRRAPDAGGRQANELR